MVNGLWERKSQEECKCCSTVASSTLPHLTGLGDVGGWFEGLGPRAQTKRHSVEKRASSIVRLRESMECLQTQPKR